MSYGNSAEEPRNTVESRQTRRCFVVRTGLAAAAFAGATGFVPRNAVAMRKRRIGSGEVTWASFGGTYNQALQQAFVDGFTQATGIKVNLIAGTNLASLKAQLASGNVLWDIAELTSIEYVIAESQKLPLVPLNTNIVKTTNVPKYAVGKYGIKYAYFLNTMAWNGNQLSAKQAPRNWAQFFDPKRYVGKRSLAQRIDDSAVLEFALIADGVRMDKLYPLNVNRALKSLQRMPKSAFLWYSNNQQVIQQLMNGESQLGMPPVGRVVIANSQGARIGYAINQGAVQSDYLVVPQGAANPDGAWQLINFICNNAAAAARFMTTTHYGVANLAGVRALSKDLQNRIPTSPRLEGKIFFRDDKWIANNYDRVNQTFKVWQANHTG